jgi:RimJ/RimL family protein N-acetyltransferase
MAKAKASVKGKASKAAKTAAVKLRERPKSRLEAKKAKPRATKSKAQAEAAPKVKNRIAKPKTRLGTPARTDKSKLAAAKAKAGAKAPAKARPAAKPVTKAKAGAAVKARAGKAKVPAKKLPLKAKAPVRVARPVAKAKPKAAPQKLKAKAPKGKSAPVRGRTAPRSIAKKPVAKQVGRTAVKAKPVAKPLPKPAKPVTKPAPAAANPAAPAAKPAPKPVKPVVEAKSPVAAPKVVPLKPAVPAPSKVEAGKPEPAPKPAKPGKPEKAQKLRLKPRLAGTPQPLPVPHEPPRPPPTPSESALILRRSIVETPSHAARSLAEATARISARRARDMLPVSIQTRRLVLRSPIRGDVPELVRLADNKRIADMLARLPHPYTRADAVAFIEIFAQRADERPYAITLNGTFIGVVGLSFHEGRPPELGYWLGEPYWGQGYMTEAAKGLIEEAQQTGLFRLIGARALADNLGSLNVLEKIGFKRVGKLTEETGHRKGLKVILLELEQPRWM